MSQEKEQNMRKSLLALAVLAFGAGLAGGSGPAAAAEYPYCLQSRIDGTQCAYTSYNQCMASASGRGAECILNPRVAFGVQADREPRAKRRADPRY